MPPLPRHDEHGLSAIRVRSTAQAKCQDKSISEVAARNKHRRNRTESIRQHTMMAQNKFPPVSMVLSAVTGDDVERALGEREG